VLEELSRTTRRPAGAYLWYYLNLDAPEEALRVFEEAVATRNVIIPFSWSALVREGVRAKPAIMERLQEIGVPTY
jgi:hypothetical protein